MLDALTTLAVVCTGLPAAMVLWNLGAYRRLRGRRGEAGDAPPAVSLLIPARNESRCIEDSLRAALANRDVELEVIVLDDHSEDDTAAIVRRIAADDPRVRLEPAPPMPAGWCGKQHACMTLSKLASHELMIFIDADVELKPDAVGRIAAAMLARPGLDLLSGFPAQRTGTLGEKLVIPLITHVLLGYLPLRWARVFTAPGFGAGCGQLFIARKDSYDQVGGHGAVRASLHDGVKLPRAYRKAGFTTDLFDASDLAVCRMYRGMDELWPGLTKNAVEGLGSPGAIGFWTVMLIGAGPLPLVAAAWAAMVGDGPALHASLAAVAMMLLPRFVLAARLGQSWLGALLHPIGLALLVAIQWHGLIRHQRGVGPRWKGRQYAGAG